MIKTQVFWMNRTLWCSLAALSLLGYAALVRAQQPDTVETRSIIITKDHAVPHVSTVPANAGEVVELFVRQRARADVFNRLDPVDRPGVEHPRRAVLMIHGASVPVLPGFELRYKEYDWALSLAEAGFDVFMLDFQGSGLSPRPTMDDPCNVPQADQEKTLIPNPLPTKCPPSYAFQLVNSKSDWDELDTVVDYIRKERNVAKVALVSWSQGSFRVGPYAVQHPEKVESLFLFAAIFNASFLPSGTGADGFGAPVPLPQLGTPMSLRTRSTLMGIPSGIPNVTPSLWDREIKCPDQVEKGIQEVVWSAIMENDPIGRTWGPPPAGAPTDSPPEGVMRVRTPTLWAWNNSVAERITVPVLIIRGEFDTGANARQDFGQLYAKIPHEHKLWFTVQCAGHFMNWERQSRFLHEISKQWLKDGAVQGRSKGKFHVDTEGNLTEIP